MNREYTNGTTGIKIISADPNPKLEKELQKIKEDNLNHKDMKYDGGKPKVGTLYEYFPNALMKVAEVSTFGCDKYKRGSFIDVPNAHERYTDAMHRHFLSEMLGEKLDPESGLLHAAHAAWGALCRLELELREKK